MKRIVFFIAALLLVLMPVCALAADNATFPEAQGAVQPVVLTADPQAGSTPVPDSLSDPLIFFQNISESLSNQYYTNPYFFYYVIGGLVLIGVVILLILLLASVSRNRKKLRRDVEPAPAEPNEAGTPAQRQAVPAEPASTHEQAPAEPETPSPQDYNSEIDRYSALPTDDVNDVGKHVGGESVPLPIVTEPGPSVDEPPAPAAEPAPLTWQTPALWAEQASPQPAAPQGQAGEAVTEETAPEQPEADQDAEPAEEWQNRQAAPWEPAQQTDPFVESAERALFEQPAEEPHPWQTAGSAAPVEPADGSADGQPEEEQPAGAEPVNEQPIDEPTAWQQHADGQPEDAPPARQEPEQTGQTEAWAESPEQPGPAEPQSSEPDWHWEPFKPQQPNEEQSGVTRPDERDEQQPAARQEPAPQPEPISEPAPPQLEGQPPEESAGRKESGSQPEQQEERFAQAGGAEQSESDDTTEEARVWAPDWMEPGHVQSITFKSETPAGNADAESEQIVEDEHVWKPAWMDATPVAQPGSAAPPSPAEDSETAQAADQSPEQPQPPADTQPVENAQKPAEPVDPAEYGFWGLGEVPSAVARGERPLGYSKYRKTVGSRVQRLHRGEDEKK